MTDTKQPDALRLAEQYDYGDPAAHSNTWKVAVCNELRRLHAENTTLQQGYDAARLEIEALRMRQCLHQIEEPAGERTAKDSTIEHAEYMAQAAERLLSAINTLNAQCDEDGAAFDEAEQAQAEEAVSEAFRAMRSRIYEFRKRRDRALRAQADSQPALPKITAEDRSFLHYNPNTDDIVEWVQHYASAAITADRAMRAQAAPAAGNWISAADVDRLVRELDVALNGEEGAAPQASLCDVVGQAKAEAAKLGRPLLAAPAARQCVECASCGSAFEVDTYMAGYTEGKGHCLNCPGINRAATEAAPAAVAGPSDNSTPGVWFVRKRERDGELLDCFVAAPDCQGFPYDAEILGDDEYREDVGRKLADCELIVSAVNAYRAAAPTTQAAPQPTVQQGDDFWPVDGKASRKQLIEQIGQMNYQLTALRQENAGLIARTKGQAEALQNYQTSAAPVAQGDAEDAARYRWLRQKFCLTDNGDGTCCMHAINLPASIKGWPEPIEAEVMNFCDAAIDAARAQAKEGASHD